MDETLQQPYMCVCDFGSQDAFVIISSASREAMKKKENKKN
jgi:hypothetical protein